MSLSTDEDIIFIRVLLSKWLINAGIAHDPIDESSRKSSLAGMEYSTFEVRRNPDGYI